MDIIKKITEQLGFLKNNSALMVPIVIGLIGAILFIPAQLISSNLNKQIENESIIKRANTINSITQNAVPSRQSEIEQVRKQAYAADANQIAFLATQSTKRELLSYKIFPEPKDSSTLIFEEFGRHYRRTIFDLITDVNALDCPTEAELQRAVEGSTVSSGSGTSHLSTSFSMMTRPSGTSYGMVGDVKDTIIDEVCRERAEKASVYINPSNLSGYDFWGQYKYDVGIKKAAEDCWYYQSAYWAIEDVLNTVDAMNGGSKSVSTSPVKRLVDVSFALGQSRTTTTGASGRGRLGSIKDRTQTKNIDDRPKYVLSIKDSTIESCTGRYCNDDIDVIHFSIVVVLRADAVMAFMKELCSAKEHRFAGFFGNEQEHPYKHNQIAILESKIRAINPDEDEHKLYRYGEDTTVELDLICEYIFNKKSYDEIKPQSVKEAQASAAADAQKKV